LIEKADNILLGFSLGSIKNVEKYLSLGFNIVVLDVLLTGTSQLCEEIIQMIQSKYKGTHIVLYSAQKDTADNLALKYHLSVIEKSITGKELINYLKNNKLI